MKIEASEWVSYFTKWISGGFESVGAAQMSFGAPDPFWLEQTIGCTFHVGAVGGLNTGYYCNEQVDEVMKAARQAPPPAADDPYAPWGLSTEAIGLWSKANQLATEDAPLMLVLSDLNPFRLRLEGERKGSDSAGVVYLPYHLARRSLSRMIGETETGPRAGGPSSLRRERRELVTTQAPARPSSRVSRGLAHLRPQARVILRPAAVRRFRHRVPCHAAGAGRSRRAPRRDRFATEKQRDQIRQSYGLDKPLVVQYGKWALRAVRGDLGRSMQLHVPVVELLSTKLFNTLLLVAGSMVLAIVAGWSMGIAAGLHPNGWLDRASLVFALAGISLPAFLVRDGPGHRVRHQSRAVPGLGYLFLNAVTAGGVIDVLWHLTLPAVATALLPAGMLVRMCRTAVIEVTRMPFVNALHARGLSQRLIARHVIRNAMPTILNVTGMQAGFLLTAAIFTEVVFNWPGLGLQIYTAVTAQGLHGRPGRRFVRMHPLFAVQHRRRRASPAVRPEDRPAMSSVPDRFARAVAADKRILTGSAVVLAIIVVSSFAPLISPYDPIEVFSGLRNSPPGTPGHILGTDQTGRDILSRLIWGGQVTLILGTVPVLAAMVVGTFLGITAAWFGGWYDWIVLRVMEVLFAFPTGPAGHSGRAGAGQGNAQCNARDGRGGRSLRHSGGARIGALDHCPDVRRSRQGPRCRALDDSLVGGSAQHHRVAGGLRSLGDAYLHHLLGRPELPGSCHRAAHAGVGHHDCRGSEGHSGRAARPDHSGAVPAGSLGFPEHAG